MSLGFSPSEIFPSAGVAPPARRGANVELLARLKAMIASGELAPGDRLPPERELAQRFGVNRTTLRQALKILETLGVIAQRVGDGTYVNADARAVLDEPMELMILLGGISLEERYAARRVVEPELAARAAETASEGDLAAMRAALDRLAAASNPAERRQADLDFHEAVLEASGNRVCHLIFRVLHRSIGIDYMARLIPLAEAVVAHRAIFAAIERRDAAAARDAMVRHLDCCSSAISRA